MDLQKIAALLAPRTSAQIDHVGRKPTPGGALAVPLALGLDVAAPALSVLNSGIGALQSIPQQYPGIGTLLSAVEDGAFAAQGQPFYREQSDLIDSQAGFFDARSRLTDAQANVEGARADLIGGFLGGMWGEGQPLGALSGGMAGGGDGFAITDPMLAGMTLSGMNEQANSLRQLRSDSRDYTQRSAERDAYGRLWSPEQVEKRRADLTKQFAPMQDLSRARAAIESAPVEGLSVPILVTALQQQLEPGLAVRQEDVRMLTEGALSGVDLTMGDVMKWVDENALAPTMVPKLKEFALRMLGAREDLYADMFENVLNEQDDLRLTDYGLRRSTPFWESGHEAIERRNARQASGPAAPAPDPPSTPAPSGNVAPATLRDLPDAVLEPILRQVEADFPQISERDALKEVQRRARQAGYVR